MTESTRFLISGEALAAAEALERGERPPNLAMLQARQLAAGDRLTPALGEALRTLANPLRTVAVSRLRPGESTYATMALAGAQQGFSVHGGDSTGHDIVWLESAEAAALHVGDFLDLTNPDFTCERGSVSFPPAGWAALVALADCVRTARLQSELSRTPDPEPARVEANLVVDAFEAGIRTEDSRWATTCALKMSPPSLDLREQHLSLGLDSLRAAGFIESDGAVLAAPGLLAVDELASAVTWGLIVVREADESAAPRALVTVRSPIAAWTLSPEAANGSCALSRVDSTALLPSLLALFEHRPATAAMPRVAQVESSSRFCGNCGAQRVTGANFCGSCGAAFPR